MSENVFNISGGSPQFHFNQVKPDWEPTEVPLNLRIRENMSKAIDEYAKHMRVTRSSAVRRLIWAGLHA